MPKPAPVLQDEYKSDKADIQSKIDAAKNAAMAAVQATDAKLSGTLNEVTKATATQAAGLQQGLDRLSADSKNYTDACIGRLREEVKAMIAQTEGKLARAEQTLSERISKVDSAMRAEMSQEIEELCKTTMGELEALKAELLKEDEAVTQKAAGMVETQKKEFQEILEQVKGDAATGDQMIKDQCAKELAKAFQAQQEKEKKEQERANRQEAEIYMKIERLQELMNEGVEGAHSETREKFDKLNTELQELKDEAVRRLGHLDDEATKAKEAIAEVENITTRRVDWVIQNASRRLRLADQSKDKASLHVSFFSPKFNIAGAHGLQLELQLYRQSDVYTAGENLGDVAVFLWACKGLNLCYRLWVGGKSATIEKIFNGRVPYGTKRFCWLKDQINPEDDTLRVGLEILEAVRELEHVIKLPKELTEQPNVPDNAAPAPLEGSVIFKKHINHRIMDQVKNQVDMMKSRMVRNVEWRVEQASMLRRCFPSGECICSATFAAAGIDGFQLVFYPSGYNGATEGCCSFFLYSPAGVYLKCCLSAGAQKREAHHYFEAAGAYGRTNFCRFEQVVDEDTDSILLSLEIEEAHQDVQATLAHPAAQAGDRRSQAQMEGTRAGPVESTVKLQRVPGKPVPGFEDRRILPSLWTAQAVAEPGETPAGYHSFEDLKDVRRGGQPAAMRKAESMSALSLDRAGEASPLPQLGKSELRKSPGGSDWSVGAKSRRPRERALAV